MGNTNVQRNAWNADNSAGSRACKVALRCHLMRHFPLQKVAHYVSPSARDLGREASSQVLDWRTVQPRRPHEWRCPSGCGSMPLFTMVSVGAADARFSAAAGPFPAKKWQIACLSSRELSPATGCCRPRGRSAAMSPKSSVISRLGNPHGDPQATRGREVVRGNPTKAAEN